MYDVSQTDLYFCHPKSHQPQNIFRKPSSSGFPFFLQFSLFQYFHLNEVVHVTGFSMMTTLQRCVAREASYAFLSDVNTPLLI